MGVHKAAALAHLCGAMRIPPAAVVAFGDMPNDLPMLRWVGRGVAQRRRRNAHLEVLQAAWAVTASNEQDGVADELERLFGVVAAHGREFDPQVIKVGDLPEKLFLFTPLLDADTASKLVQLIASS